MKARSYIQLPLTLFRAMFPEQAKGLPLFLDEDPNYIVRYEYAANRIEIGYIDDKWLIE